MKKDTESIQSNNTPQLNDQQAQIMSRLENLRSEGISGKDMEKIKKEVIARKNIHDIPKILEPMEKNYIFN